MSKVKKRLDRWSDFKSNRITASHVYKHSKLESYVNKYSKPNDYHVVDRTLSTFLDNMGIGYDLEPASIYDPNQLFKTLEVFGHQVDESKFMKDEHMQRAMRRAMKVFGYNERFPKLVVVDDEQSIRNSVKLDKSGGAWFESKEASWDKAWAHSRKVLKREAWFKPSLAFYRTQSGNKSRLVWGTPTDSIIVQGMFAPQIIELFKHLPVITLGDRRFELGALTGSIAARRRHLFGLDFSKFDATIPKFLIVHAFRILKTWFGPMTDEQEFGWQIMVENFLHQSIIMPDGYVYIGKCRGIPSGDWLTNIIGSICNFTVITYGTSRLGHMVYSENIIVHGDDSYFGLDVDLDLDELANVFSELGMVLNPRKSEKGSIYKPIKYLGFYWNRGRGYRDFDELLNSAVNPETYPDKSQYSDRDDWITDRLLVLMSLSHDGVQQAEKRGLGELYDFDRANIGNMEMNYQKGISGYMDYNREYVLGIRSDDAKAAKFTWSRAKFG